MIVLALFIFLLIGQKLVVLIGFQLRFKSAEPLAEDQLPTVAILVPARNEAGNIKHCLDALLALDYPVDKLEILVGNDQSSDETAAIVSAYTSRHKHIKLLATREDYHGLVARSNVLAQLATASEGDYLVFLDADMEVRSGWLRTMVAPTARGFDMVSGYTEVKAHGWLSRFQQIDWLNVIMLLKAGADLGLPGTALGNNMLVSRAAYEAVGGYEQLGPTFTEDNDLTLAIRKKGMKVFQVAGTEGALTLAISGLSDLYSQRNRWMQGAFRQPLLRLLPLIVSRVFMLWAMLMLFWSYQWAFAFVLTVAFWEMVLSMTMARKPKLPFPYTLRSWPRFLILF